MNVTKCFLPQNQGHTQPKAREEIQEHWLASLKECLYEGTVRGIDIELHIFSTFKCLLSFINRVANNVHYVNYARLNHVLNITVHSVYIKDFYLHLVDLWKILNYFGNSVNRDQLILVFIDCSIIFCIIQNNIPHLGFFF